MFMDSTYRLLAEKANNVEEPKNYFGHRIRILKIKIVSILNLYDGTEIL